MNQKFLNLKLTASKNKASNNRLELSAHLNLNRTKKWRNEAIISYKMPKVKNLSRKSLQLQMQRKNVEAICQVVARVCSKQLATLLTLLIITTSIIS
jgi:hypothetical protein